MSVTASPLEGAEHAAAAVGRLDPVARSRAWPLVIWTATAVWSVLLFGVVRTAFMGYQFGRFDLGNMVQAVWSTTQGRPLEYTHSAGEQMVRLGVHADPFLVLLSPLWAVWPSPLALAFAQVVVVAAGALPVFWLGRRHLDSDTSAGLLALAYLAYPWIATSAAGAIHPVTFAITFLLFAVWFLDTGRFGAFVVCAILTMSTGELMGLPIVGLGIWYALARGQRVRGAIAATAGAAWTMLAVFVIVPAFAGGDSMYYEFYDQVGGSPQGVVRQLVSDPAHVLSALVELHDIVYVLWLGIPLLGLFLLSPGLAAIAIPQLLANTLSDFRSMTDPRYHSVAAIVPFLFAATAIGLSRVAPARRSPLGAAVLVSCAVVSLAIGPWARLVGAVPFGAGEGMAAGRIAALNAAVALVPDGVAVSASNTAAVRLSDRRRVYSVPVLGDATWVVIDLRDPWVVRKGSPILSSDSDEVAVLARTLDSAPGWRRVSRADGVLVFARAG